MLRYRVIPVTAFQQNCSLVWCDETMHAAFVDPGGDAAELIRAATDARVTVKQMLITHAHIDHAGAAAQMAEHFGVTIVGPHSGDGYWIEQMEQQARMFGLSGARKFSPNRWLVDGDTVQLGNLKFDVRHCPGHTPGHVVFHAAAAKRAFVGDVLFAGSIGRTDFPGGDYSQLIESITTRLWPMGDDTVFVPGHGPESSFGQERRHNPFVGGT